MKRLITNFRSGIFCLSATGLLAQGTQKIRPPSPESLTSPSPSETLEKVRDQLQQEAAHIQIQGRALTPDEQQRLKTIEQVIDPLTKIINSLKVTKL